MLNCRSFVIGLLVGVTVCLFVTSIIDFDTSSLGSFRSERSSALCRHGGPTQPFEKTFATSSKSNGYGVGFSSIGSDFAFLAHTDENRTDVVGGGITDAAALIPPEESGGALEAARSGSINNTPAPHNAGASLALPHHRQRHYAMRAQTKYPNTTGPLMLYEDLPFPEHPPSTNTFLVTIGVMSIDSAFGASRRKLIRSSWMTYNDVWKPELKRSHVKLGQDNDGTNHTYSPNVLVKFVVGRHHANQYQFTDQLLEEARDTETYNDIVAVSILEKQSSSGKKNSTKYGIWGLESMLSTELKSFIWRRIALASYATSFVAKADDDIFLVVPNYVATLRVMPRKEMSWGYHSLVERDPGYQHTTFPYNVGPIATASADIANTMATSSILSFLSKPFTGRPADYFTRRCDHEDYGTYSSVSESKVRMKVFHDCRFVEPYIHGKEFFRPPPLEANGEVDPTAPPHSPMRLDRRYFVNFHKLEPDLFPKALEWFPDVDDSGESLPPPPTFTSVEVKGIPSRFGMYLSRGAIAKECGQLTKVNYHTYWKELGPMQFQVTDNLHDYVQSCSHLSLARNFTKPILLVLGIMERKAEYRVRYRTMMNGAPDLWTWWNQSNPVMVRFPIFFSGKGVTRKQFWECHRFQDMVSIPKSVVPFEARGSLHGFLWLRRARRLYPTAKFIGAMYGVPKMWNAFTLPSYFASLINHTIRRATATADEGGGGGASSTLPHIILHNYVGMPPPHQQGKATKTQYDQLKRNMNRVAFTIVSTSVAWTIPFSFPLATSDEVVSNAVRASPSKPHQLHHLASFNALLYQSVAKNVVTERRPAVVVVNSGRDTPVLTVPDEIAPSVSIHDDDATKNESDVNMISKPAGSEEAAQPQIAASTTPAVSETGSNGPPLPTSLLSICVCNRASIALKDESSPPFVVHPRTTLEEGPIKLPPDGGELVPRKFFSACDDGEAALAIQPAESDTCWF